MSRIYWRAGRKCYFYDFVDADGVRHRGRASADRRVAEEILRAKETEVDRVKAGLQDRVGQGIALDILKERFLRDIKATRSAATHHSHEYCLGKLLPLLPAKTVRDLSPGVFTSAIEQFRKNKHATRTINIIMGSLRAMIRWALRARIIGSDPLAGLQMLPNERTTRRRRALAEEEIKKLLDASPADRRRVWMTFIYTGLRKSELATLTWEDLNLDRGEITVQSENAKTKKQRTIPLRADLHAVLSAWKESHPDPSDTAPVFVSAAGTPLDLRNILRDLKSDLAEAKVNAVGVDVHALRYTFCTHLCKSGVNIKTAQVLMGHSDIRLTMDIYTDPTLLDKRGAVEALPAFGAPSHPEAARATGTDGPVEAPGPNISASKWHPNGTTDREGGAGRPGSRRNSLKNLPMRGGPERIRTADPLVANQMLSR